MAKFSIGPGKVEDYIAPRAGRQTVEIDPDLLGQITALLQEHGIVQISDMYTATLPETEVYNGKRETWAKSNGKEVPAPINVVQMATRNARTAAAGLTPYIEQIVDTVITDKSFSLRFVNRGTEDHPKVQFAFVLVPKRAPRAK